MTKGLLTLVGGTLIFCGLTTYPLRLLGEKQGWEHTELTYLWGLTAAALCLVPTALTLLWTRWAYKGRPEQQLIAVLGGTGVRLLAVLGGAMILFLSVEQFGYQRFWFFVVVYYLVTLALEMVLVVRGTAAEQAQPKN